MFNEERKLRFLSETRASKDYGVSAFNATEKAEEEHGKDLCELDAETIQSLFDKSFGLRKRATESAIAFMQSYVKWCKDNGFQTTDSVFNLEVDTSQKIRRMMVASPMHLASIMDQTFPPVDAGTVDCIYRCYLWMIFAGVKEADTVNVNVDDVDWDTFTIQIGDRSYDIFREAIPAFRLACTATEFVYIHPRYKTTRNRFPGEKLMRGVRSDHVKLETVRPYVKKKFTEHGFDLSQGRIYLSGIFYKAFEAERCGFGVNFDDAVIDQLKSTDRTYSANYTRNKAAYTILRDFMDDYERWKKAFAVVLERLCLSFFLLYQHNSM